MKKFDFIKPDFTYKTNLMAFGFECNKGWYPLIEDTLVKIDEILKNNHQGDDVDSFEILQIKEKFGELRIYTSIYLDDIEEIISKATEKSLVTCEICGETGELRERRRWLKTLCDKHFKEWSVG